MTQTQEPKWPPLDTGLQADTATVRVVERGIVSRMLSEEPITVDEPSAARTVMQEAQDKIFTAAEEAALEGQAAIADALDWLAVLKTEISRDLRHRLPTLVTALLEEILEERRLRG